MHPNPKAMGPVAYKGNQWVGYDDIDIVKKKGEYVAENGLGGKNLLIIDTNVAWLVSLQRVGQHDSQWHEYSQGRQKMWLRMDLEVSWMTFAILCYAYIFSYFPVLPKFAQTVFDDFVVLSLSYGLFLWGNSSVVSKVSLIEWCWSVWSIVTA